MSSNEEQRRYISELYELSGNRRTLAAEMFYERFGLTITPGLISGRWYKEGLARNPHGGRRHGISDEQFLDLYNHCKGNVDLMVDLSGFLPSSMLSRCQKMNLPFEKSQSQIRRGSLWDIDPDFIKPGGKKKGGKK